jgi:hypothetical protein
MREDANLEPNLGVASPAFRISIFSPFAAIWQHALPEEQLAILLSSSGFDVSVVGCDFHYKDFCTAMEAFKVSFADSAPSKEKICGSCTKSRSRLSLMGQRAGVHSKRLTNLASVGALPTELEEMLEFSLDGVPIGRIAAYETLIKFKKTDANLNELESGHFAISLSNAKKVFNQAREYLSKEQPDLVICYSPQYGVPGVFAAVAKSMGIRVLFMEASSNDAERYSHLRMWDWDKYGLTQPALKHLESFDSYQLNKSRISRARRQLESRFDSKAFAVYSTARSGRDPYEFFGLQRDKKTILLSMSSYDEVYSGYFINRLPRERQHSTVFDNQVDWLRATLNWAQENPEIQFIVRPHPRELPNKREGVTSSHSQAWVRLLKTVPANVRVDYPHFGFSIFDHLDHIDVLSTGWSSTGIDALAKGIPVVTYDSDLPTFPSSIHLTGKSAERYFENLLEACKAGISEVNKLNALRWLAFTSEVGTVEIGGRATDRVNLSAVKPLFKYVNSKYFKHLVRPFDIRAKTILKDRDRIMQLVLGRTSCLFETGYDSTKLSPPK